MAAAERPHRTVGTVAAMEPMLRDRLGRPLTDLRMSVTDRCNFRCRYCMPREVFGPDHAFLERDELLTFEELALLGEVFTSLGVSKLRLTGGEPLLRRGLPDLVAMLSRLEGVDDLAMTTNGTALPGAATALRDAGLHRVTVSLDAIDDATHRAIADVNTPVDAVLAGIDAALDAGLPVKVNTVLKRGVNEDQILPLAAYGRERGVTVRFIEYMDVGATNGWRMADVVPADEVLATIGAQWPVTAVPPRSEGQVAEQYTYDDGAGRVGVIASVTRPFCRGCSRARLSSLGELYTCLFATRGTDLRGLLRDGADAAALRAAITGVWSARTDRYSELRTDETRGSGRVEMSYIGG
jgi:cyclic pyranopterin phosphate synthase